MLLLLDIAWTHIRSRTRQTVVALAGVATGVGFSIAMAALMQGSQEDFVQQMIDAMPHINVSDDFRAPEPQPVDLLAAGGAIALRGLKPKEELRGIKNAKARIAQLRRLPGVDVAPTLTGSVVLRYGGKDIGVSLAGIEPEAEARVSKLEQDMRSGSLTALHTIANGIIVGDGLADKLGADLGATLTVSTPSGQPRRMKIAGIFHNGVVSLDNGQAYTLLKTAQILLDQPNVINRIRLRIDDINQARPLARRIEGMLGYRSESWEEANESILEVFFIRNIIMFTVVGAILLVAGFGIFNIVSTITHEKIRDIAILKSLGFRQRDIQTIFVAEGLLFGAAGSLCGWFLGYALCRLLGAIPFEVSTFTDITHLPLLYSPLHYLIAALFALSSAGIAGYLPARRAARLNPVDIVRGAG
jgi:lipoprotein-releasing system permease protein